MKKYIFPILLCWLCFASNLWASHIVGGEIEFYVVNRTENRFYVGLNLYFDEANGRAEAETRTVKLYFYRKGDNQYMGQVELPQTTRKRISYTNPACDISNAANLQTLLMRYSSEIIINSSAYDDPRGYYIVWERCCRNVIVNNIINPDNTGETFYTEFPALIQNKQVFVNSSPRFPELKGDYICINRPFTFDFGGKDIDGDSLVYSLTTPWAGYATRSVAEPIPRGSSYYPEVNWVPGISVNNMIPGPKPLSINKRTGVLSVTADKLGLYVFAVQVEEFRKGVKIGLVRREFQLKVIDCPRNEPPKALYREAGKKNFYVKGETITIKPNQTKCIDVLITDADANQKLTINAIGLNFNDQGITINPISYTTKSITDTLKAQVCFDKCIESHNNQPLVLEIIVSDDGCPQPRTDTLNVRLLIEETPNNPPDVVTDLANNKATVQQGNTLTFKVIGTDKDNDDILLEARGRGFQLAQVGMAFNNVTGKGNITQNFAWTPSCNATNTDYVVDFIITDVSCNRQTKDTVSVTLRALTTSNNPPKVSTSLPPTQMVAIPLPTSDASSALTFDVYADDTDRTDLLKLKALGQGFTLSQYKMKFDEKSGNPRLVSQFEWKATCEQYAQFANKELAIKFVAEDNSCSAVKTDTILVKLQFGSLPVSSNIEKDIPNVITPNGDGKNDCFYVEGLSNVSCGLEFEQIQIYNRWGKTIYTSINTQFKWCAEQVTSGVYYYILRFKNQQLKGTLTVIK